jgi:putative endonuclease
MDQHNTIGRIGEEIAAKHLKHHGYSLRARNWTKHKAELDIVAQKDGLLVVVEVKTRQGPIQDDARDLVPPAKRKMIIKGTQYYLEDFDLDLEVRFDVILVGMIAGNDEIQHYEDAFAPEIE